MMLRMILRLFCLFSFTFLLTDALSFQALAQSTPPLSPQTKESQAKENAQDLLKQGKDFMRSRQYEKAAEVFKEIITQQPNSAVAYSHFGAATLMQGKPKE